MRIPFALGIILAAMAFGAIGLSVNPYLSFVLTRVLVYVILTMGLNILMGYAGQFAFVHAALYGIGAYVAGLLEVRLGFSFLPAAILATVAATAIGAVLTFPALRLSGLYLALSTLAVAQAIQWVLMNWTSLTYGPGGFRAPTLSLGHGLDSNRSIFLVALAAAATLAIFTDNLLRSRFGRAFVAIRDNPQAAASMGVDVTMTKTIAFALSAAFAGLAGALSSALLGFVSPESYSLDQMVMIQIMVVLGGLGSLIGSLIGPVLVLSLLEALRDTGGFMEVAFGAILIGAVLFQPKGIAGFLRRRGSSAAFMPRSLKSRAGGGA